MMRKLVPTVKELMVEVGTVDLLSQTWIPQSTFCSLDTCLGFMCISYLLSQTTDISK